MKRIIIFSCIFLLAIANVYAQNIDTLDPKDDTPLGASYYLQDQGIYTAPFDNMTRTECYGELYEKNIIYFRYADPTLGISIPMGFGPLVAIAQYNNDSISSNVKEEFTAFNGKYIDITEYNIETSDTANMNLNVGIGAGFSKMIGVLYIMGLERRTREYKSQETTSAKTNGVTLWKNEVQDIEALLKNGNKSAHIIEGGIHMGNLRGTLQLQLWSENGANEDNYMKEDTTTYDGAVTGLVTKKEKNYQTGIDAGNDCATFNNKNLASSIMQIEAEISYTMDMGTVYFRTVLGSRSIDDDTTYETEIDTENMSGGVVIDKTNTKTTVTYTKNSDSMNQFQLKFKKKFKLGDDVKLGLYPKYTLGMAKADYDIQNKMVETGTVYDPGTQTSVGNDDNVLLEESSHTIQIPFGMDAKVTKALSLQFGASIQYMIKSLKRTTTEKSGYITDSRTPVPPSYNKYSEIVNTKEWTEYTFSKSLGFGANLEIVENLILDLQSITATDFAIHTWLLSATYMF